MAEQPRLVRIPSLKSAAEFRARCAALGVELPCDDEILRGTESPLARPLSTVQINGKTLTNRLAIQPMEGWDGSRAGTVTDEVRRRWRRFGESGAALICGGEAMAVRADGRANPNQLIISDETKPGLTELCQIVRRCHQERHEGGGTVVIGFQLTHSGRFCKPNSHSQPEPRVAFRHPVLDGRSGVTSDAQVFTDAEIDDLIQDYVHGAQIAWEAGADFVDIKHCHGYLLHEFLSAFERPGRFGGAFENRTRILREIVQGIRTSGNKIDLAVRLSGFDFVPYRADPASSTPGKPGVGVPEDLADRLPFRWGFGLNPLNPLEIDLSETFRFADLCCELGIKLLNLTGGSPYYNPHIQRPAAYPPSDGYQPPEDPLIGVARQIEVVRKVRAHVDGRSGRPGAGEYSPGANLVLVGSAYSYLQEYFPHVAQAVVRLGWTDLVGIGRMVLSYPEIMADAWSKGELTAKSICRTFSDCTTAPRNGMISGCYPLDSFYSGRSEAQQLKAIKQGRNRPGS